MTDVLLACEVCLVELEKKEGVGMYCPGCGKHKWMVPDGYVEHDERLIRQSSWLKARPQRRSP